MNFAPIRSLARHTAVYSVGDFVGRAVAVLLLPLYMRALTTEANGLISISFALIGFSGVLYSLGLNQALIRFLSGVRVDNDLDRRRFSTAFFTLLVMGTTISSLMWTCAEELAGFALGTIDNADILRMLAVIIFLDTLSEPLFTLCRARQHSTRFALARLCQNTLQMVLIVYLIAFRGEGVRAVFAANIVSSAFAFLVMAPVAMGALRPVFRLDLLRELLRFGLPFVPSAVSALVISLSDRFLIEHFLGLEALGVYGVAFKFSIPMLLIVRAFRSAWAPGVLAVKDPREAREVCARITTYFLTSAAIMFLFVVGFSRELVTIVGGGRAMDYVDAHSVIPLVTLGHVLYGVYVILTAGVYAEGRTRMLPAVVAVGASLNVAVNLVMIPQIGYIAAAWSTVAANTVMVALLYVITRRFYPVPYEFTRIGKVIAATVIVAVALGRFSADITTAGTAARFITLLAYPLILWGWGFLEPREWQDLRSLFQKPVPPAEDR